MKLQKIDLIILLGIILALIPSIVCPPVNPNKVEEKVKDTKEGTHEADDALGLEYEKYLREVFTILEQDETFRKKIEADPDVKKSDISRHLEFVNHNVRTKLDEVKRREIERIKALMKERVHKQQGKDVDWKAIMPAMDHLDIKNPDSFEIKDLDRLIKQATSDLDAVDKKRREEFKQYELEKEHERREKLRSMDTEHRKKAEEEYETQKKKHKEHPKLHEPGSKAQLEEVWEKEDHLEKDQFDPKAFFKLHDTNGDGFLTADEVEALFNVELQKLYEEGHPEDDMVEKFEEMNRMREKVYKEIDANKDGAISLEEFLNSTKSKEFEKDEGWKGLDEEEQFTEDDLKEYEKNLKDDGAGDTLEHEETKPKMEVPEVPKAGGVVQMDQAAAAAAAAQEAPKAAQQATKDAPPAPKK